MKPGSNARPAPKVRNPVADLRLDSHRAQLEQLAPDDDCGHNIAQRFLGDISDHDLILLPTGARACGKDSEYGCRMPETLSAIVSPARKSDHVARSQEQRPASAV